MNEEEQNQKNQTTKINMTLLIIALIIAFLCIIELLMQLYSIQQQHLEFVKYINQSCICLM